MSLHPLRASPFEVVFKTLALPFCRAKTRSDLSPRPCIQFGKKNRAL